MLRLRKVQERARVNGLLPPRLPAVTFLAGSFSPHRKEIRKMRLSGRIRKWGLCGLMAFLTAALTIPMAARAQMGDARHGQDPTRAGRHSLFLPAGTLLKLKPVRSLSSNSVKQGEAIHLRLQEDVFAGPAAVIPAGTVVEGSIVGVRRPGFIARRSRLRIHLDALVTRGVALDLTCADLRLKGATTLGKKALSGMTTVAAGSVSPVAGVLVGTRLLRRGPEVRIGPHSLLVTRLLEPLEIPIQLSGPPGCSRKRQKP